MMNNSATIAPVSGPTSSSLSNVTGNNGSSRFTFSPRLIGRPSSYRLSTSEDFVFYVSFLTINIVNATCNALIVSMFIRFRTQLLTINNNILLLSLTCADLLVGVSGSVAGIYYIYSISTYKFHTFEWFLISINPIFLSFFTSILSLAAIALDRVIAVATPLRYPSIMPVHRTKAVIAIIWVTPFLLTTSEALIYDNFPYRTELKVRSLILTGFFIVAVIILTISNSYLQIVLLNQRRRLRPTQYSSNETQSSHSSTLNNNPEKKRFPQSPQSLHRVRSYAKQINTVCVWMTALFVLCWLPTLIYYSRYWTMIDTSEVYQYKFRRWGICLAVSNSFLNPVLYILLRKDFRRYLLQIFKDGFAPCHQ